MLIILLSLAITFVGIISLQPISNWDCEIAIGISVIGTVFFGIIFIASLLVLPFSRMQIYSDINSYKAIQNTLNYSRIPKKSTIFENIAIQQQIIKINAKIASDKYYAKKLWTNWFYPKAILKIKYIK